jgi:hypothetical protein
MLDDLSENGSDLELDNINQRQAMGIWCHELPAIEHYYHSVQSSIALWGKGAAYPTWDLVQYMVGRSM